MSKIDGHVLAAVVFTFVTKGVAGMADYDLPWWAAALFAFGLVFTAWALVALDGDGGWR